MTTDALRSSASQEWFTPREIVDAAREVMGSIELDPASCEEANLTVRAARIYTIEDDGLRQPWEADTAWLNMPYGKSDDDNRSNQAVWSHRMMNAYRAGLVGQACVLVNAVPGNRWFVPLWRHPICFLGGRVRFIPPAGSGAKNSPTHSSCVVYFGPHEQRFADVFGRLGHVVRPLQVTSAPPQGGLELEVL